MTFRGTQSGSNPQTAQSGGATAGNDRKPSWEPATTVSCSCELSAKKARTASTAKPTDIKHVLAEAASFLLRKSLRARNGIASPNRTKAFSAASPKIQTPKNA